MPDPAAGKFEVPGGHLEQDESARAAAIREWQEETGLNFPDGEWTGTWTSANGIYQGFVLTIPREADLDTFGRQIGTDPDGDCDGAETIAWWDPADLPGNPAVRPELLADIDAVLSALGSTPDTGCCGAGCCTGGCCCGHGGCQCGPPAPSDGDKSTCPCGTPAVYDDLNGWQHADGSVSHDDGESVSDKMGPVAKAADARPKRPGPSGDAWPGWVLDLQAAGYWAPLLAAELSRVLSTARAERLAGDYLAAFPPEEQDSGGKKDKVDAAAAWLSGQGLDFTAAIAPLIPGIVADSWLIGGACAAALCDGTGPDLAGWQPGDADSARQQAEALGIGAGLSAALMDPSGIAQGISGGYLTGLGRALVDGAAAALGAAGIGASLVSYLQDPANARRSVLGLLATAIGAAAMALYLKLKVQRVRFVTAEDARVCPRCDALEAAGPYRIENAPTVPVHPGCRCECIPD